MSFIRESRKLLKVPTDKFGVAVGMVDFKNNCNIGEFMPVGSVRNLGETMVIQPLMSYELGKRVLFPFDSNKPKITDWTLIVFLTEYNNNTVLGCMLLKSFNQGNFHQMEEKIDVVSDGKYDIADLMITMTMIDNPKASEKSHIKFTFGKDKKGKLSDGYGKDGKQIANFEFDLLTNHECQDCTCTETGEVTSYKNLYARNEAFALDKNLEFVPASIIAELCLWRDYKGDKMAFNEARKSTLLPILGKYCDIAVTHGFFGNKTAIATIAAAKDGNYQQRIAKALIK